jgi:Stage II sporulation protein E (SpoIIE)
LRKVFAWLVLVAIAVPVLGQTQAVDATQWRAGTVDLDHGWREHDGDDPAWAQSNFGDSGWKTVELNDMGAAQPRWRWFRLHVKLAPNHPHVHLLMAGGEGTFELYINGEAVPETQLRTLFVKRPTEQVIPLHDGDTDLEIALRTHATPLYTMWDLPLFLTAAVGTPAAIENEQQAMQSQRLYAAVPSIAINLVLMLAGLGAFALYRSQRKHFEYLWLGLYLFLLGTSNLVLYCANTGVISLAWIDLVGDPLVYAFTIMQIEFTFSFAGRRVGRLWRIYEVLMPLPLILSVLVMAGRFSSSAYGVIEALAILPAALGLPLLLFVWFRRGNREAGWLILPSLLPAATTALFDLGSSSIFSGWGWADFLANPIRVGPIPLQPTDIGDFLFVLAIGVVMFFRFTRVSREQTRVAAELAAAREIQQRLVPAKLPEVKGYSIEAAYFPADEVGGDFYQVLEQGDGSTLAVVGDVSGKGLKAAMKGTLAIGALRTLASQGLSPAALLTLLNRQIVRTHESGFITCICAHISANTITIANAGHLPPYRNGNELAVEPGLPLGIVSEAEYREHTFALSPGDRLIFLSDGVVEAMNESRELFGFERTQAISNQSAHAIAAAAQKFGQQDDISVLSIKFAPAEMALA